MPAPELPSTSRDLSEAELDELDTWLAALPEPLMPMDVVMLDGYLCGVIVQPVVIDPAQWLAPVFDIEDGRALDADTPGRDRAVSLVLRRHAALNAALHDDGWFEPLIADLGDDEEEVQTGSADDDAANDGGDALAEVDPVSRPLVPWVAGFELACVRFEALLESRDDAVAAALLRIFRHLPAESDEQREVAAMLDREAPLASLDDAIDELVASVADLAELTQDERYHVETIRREAPKVGRNDPCPCGSGKKFKRCHGAQ